MEIINIETPRLRLRAFTMEDFDALWEIFGDPVVMEHVAPYTEEETREFLRTFCVSQKWLRRFCEKGLPQRPHCPNSSTKILLTFSAPCALRWSVSIKSSGVKRSPWLKSTK